MAIGSRGREDPACSRSWSGAGHRWCPCLRADLPLVSASGCPGAEARYPAHRLGVQTIRTTVTAELILDVRARKDTRSPRRRVTVGPPWRLPRPAPRTGAWRRYAWTAQLSTRTAAHCAATAALAEGSTAPCHWHSRLDPARMASGTALAAGGRHGALRPQEPRARRTPDGHHLRRDRPPRG